MVVVLAIVCWVAASIVVSLIIGAALRFADSVRPIPVLTRRTGPVRVVRRF